MKAHDIIQFVKKVSYKDWKIEAFIDIEEEYRAHRERREPNVVIMYTMWVPDATKGQHNDQVPKIKISSSTVICPDSLNLSSWDKAKELLKQAVYRGIVAMEMHELAEWLKFDGVHYAIAHPETKAG